MTQADEKKTVDDESNLDRDELDEVDERQRIGAHVVYETIRREGLEELARPFPSLFWSGIAAGLGIGFSVVTEGLLHAYLPDAPWRPLVENFGYCVGFLIVILARQQLFTENTITVVLPLLIDFSKRNLHALVRLWSTVFAANMIGTLLFACVLASGLFFPEQAQKGFLGVSLHLMENDALEMFCRGIIAGWLIATLVWMLPSAGSASFWLIILMTYLIALGDLSHVVAGSVEVFFLFLVGEISIADVTLGFLFPALAGNIVGGTVLFALIAYAQVKDEV